MNEREREILLVTQEECAEVTQAISKCFRFGMDQIKPGKSFTNREHLEEELGDLVAMIKLLSEFNIVKLDNIETASFNKIEKLKQWSNIFTEEV